MTRRLAAVLGLVAVLAMAGTVLQTQAPASARSDLPRLLPPGPLVVVDTADFSSLLEDWNGSLARSRWLESANRDAFIRSRLFLRLAEARDELALAGGVPPDMARLAEMAGRESILGIYDIGELEMLYVTRLPSARALATGLWRERGNYEPRESAGTPFYVRRDPGSNRVVAMAARDDYLLVATREDLIAGALANMASPEPLSVTGEGWYGRAVAAAGAPGDVRMVMHLAALVKTPHFRSYWIQGNVTEISQFSAGVSDLTRSRGALRETRVLLRAEARDASPEDGALGRVVRLVPDGAGLYRAWERPTAAEARQLVMDEVVAPRPGAGARDPAAPRVALTDGVVGTAADYERRIDDEIRGPQAAVFDRAVLDGLLDGSPLLAALHVEATRDAADGVFVDRGSVVVLERAEPWPAGAAADALLRVVEPVWARPGAGRRFVSAGTPAEPFARLDGLERLAIAERGALLFVSNDPALLSVALAAVARPPADVRGHYAGGFRHALERERFVRLMRFVDTGAGLDGSRQPPFFSGNLASLGDSLAQVSDASIVVRDMGETVSQTVTYALAP